MRSAIMAMVCGCAVVGTTALAQDPAPSNPLVSALVRCKAMTDEGARVRCYDAAVDKLVDATARGSVVVVDREDIRKTRRSLFGFSLPKLPLFSGDNPKEEQAEEIEAKIQAVRNLGNGKWLIVLDSGARWQTTESMEMQADPREGDAINIKKQLMGSYFLKVEGRRAVRGMRVG